eukprot:1234715-Pyramimonas_sp.AAC.1
MHAARRIARRCVPATQTKHWQPLIIFADCYTALVTPHEFKAGPLTPTQLKNALDLGGNVFKALLTIDADSVSQSMRART